MLIWAIISGGVALPLGGLLWLILNTDFESYHPRDRNAYQWRNSPRL